MDKSKNQIKTTIIIGAKTISFNVVGTGKYTNINEYVNVRRHRVQQTQKESELIYIITNTNK